MDDHFSHLPLISPDQSEPQQGVSTRPPAAENSGFRPDPRFTEQAKLLLGQFRKDDAHDPEMYYAALVTLLSDYPIDVVRYACDPRTGIASVHQWLPQIFEVRAFLEDRMRPRREDEERTRRVEEQLKAREEWLGERTPEEQARRKQIADDWLSRKDLRAALLTGLLNSESAARREEGLAYIQHANEKQFTRECKEAGVDPASQTVSPSLRKVLDEQAKNSAAIASPIVTRPADAAEKKFDPPPF